MNSLCSCGSIGPRGPSLVSSSYSKSSSACSPATPSTTSPCPASFLAMSSDDPFFVLGRGIGSLWGDFSLNSNISTSASLHSSMIKDGWMRALEHHPYVDLMIPLLMTCPTSNFMSWTIAYIRIVLSLVTVER